MPTSRTTLRRHPERAADRAIACAVLDEALHCDVALVRDGLVLAKSVFHHSLDYRSVVVFGTARRVTDRDEKLAALKAITEHVAPGRWSAARRPTDRELQETEVLALPIEELSAKHRYGPPVEAPFDVDLDVWSGVVPVSTVQGEPVPAPA